jgi:hypothetical protein
MGIAHLSHMICGTRTSSIDLFNTFSNNLWYIAMGIANLIGYMATKDITWLWRSQHDIV